MKFSIIVFMVFYQCFAVENQTKIDISTCKSFVTRKYSYTTFYHILSDLTSSTKNGYLLDFHFGIQAPRDAHVLLSQSSNLKNEDDVYEIVLGGGRNQFCDIRRKQLGSSKASTRKPNLLSVFDVKFFWIRLSKDGTLEIGSEDEELAFLSWTDPNPIQINYVSLCSWSNVEAKWLYDCQPADNDTQNQTTVIVEEPKTLTPIEQLREDMLSDYDPYLVPIAAENDFKIVLLHLTCQYVTLDKRSSVMNVNGVFHIFWKDERIQWNPENYTNISSLHLTEREIWQPDLYLYNAAGTGADILNSAPLVVRYDGSVQWSPQTSMRAWCSLKGFSYWPADEHTCQLQLGFWTLQLYLELLVAVANGTKLEQPIGSEWIITEMKSDTTTSKLENSSSSEYYNGMVPSIIISLTLRRRNPAYATILSIPLYFTTIMALLTFWISPKSFARMTSCCLQMLILTVFLLTIAWDIPIHSSGITGIVKSYTYSMACSLGVLFITTLNIYITRWEHTATLPNFISNIFMSSIIQMVLFLPKLQDDSKYGNLNASTTQLNGSRNLWITLGIAIDRIAFFVYIFLISGYFILHN